MRLAGKQTIWVSACSCFLVSPANREDVLDLGEMKAEMVVNNFLRSCELRFAGSLDQENQVVRTSSKPDQHIHVVLYFVDPASFSWSFVSGAFKSRQNAKRHSMKRSRSASMSSTNTKRTVKESPTGMDLPDDVEELLTSSLDLRLMKKLSKRASVLPVSLTCILECTQLSLVSLTGHSQGRHLNQTAAQGCKSSIRPRHASRRP